MPSSRLVYAIDYGTTNTLLAAADADRLHDPIPLDPFGKDQTVLRSILFFPSMHKVHYGADAIRQYIESGGQGRLIRSIKKQLPIRSFIGTWIDERPVNLEDLIGYFLKEVRERANKHFGVDVDSAVIGRPARFAAEDIDDSFAQYRLEEAARRAGFKHIEFCPEPVAAACEFRSRLTEPRTVLVGDFGGGTSDFTVIRMSREPFQPADVLSIGGVSVAGDALEGAMMRDKIAGYFGADVKYKVPFGTNVMHMPTHLMEKICSPADISLLTKRDMKEFLERVKQWALSAEDRKKMDWLFCLIDDQLGFDVFEKIERTKCGLSDAEAAEFLYEHPVINIREKISRREFEEAVGTRLDKIIASLDETVRNAGLKFADIDVVCCTGGTAKVPAIQKALEKRFGGDKIQQHNHFHSVVKGLAERAQTLARS